MDKHLQQKWSKLELALSRFVVSLKELQATINELKTVVATARGAK